MSKTKNLKYELLEKDDKYEVRKYEKPYVVLKANNFMHIVKFLTGSNSLNKRLIPPFKRPALTTKNGYELYIMEDYTIENCPKSIIDEVTIDTVYLGKVVSKMFYGLQSEGNVK